jgi:hypothetical protein
MKITYHTRTIFRIQRKGSMWNVSYMCNRKNKKDPNKELKG